VRANPPSLLNPQVIFEVLSPSTEAFDRGDKFARYRKLDSLTDYIVVLAERIRVEQHTRQLSGVWIYAEYAHLSNALRLASLGCELPLAEIYEQVTFTEPGSGR
jgi:Uma2 family endonuclease